MRKFAIILISIFILFGCKQETSYMKIKGIEEVTYEKLSEMKNSKVQFLLYIGRSDCGDCNEFYPILEEYINTHDNTGIYYINIKEMRDNARKETATQKEKEFYENFYEEFDVDWTPTLEIIRNGKIEKKYQYLDEDYIKIKDREEQKRKKQDFINEFNQFMDSYFEEVNNE